MLSASGSLSINDLKTEFTGPTPSGLANYYRKGSYVADSWYNRNIPTSGVISLSDFYGGFVGWDTGTFSVSSQGETDYTIPTISGANSQSFLVKHYGGWGQSAEDGRLAILNSSGSIIISLSEGSGATLPSGKSLYSVNSSNVETLISTFPDQSQSAHYVYLEIQNVGNLSTFRSNGAPPNVSNPTTFVNARLYTNFTRTDVLASMGGSDVYYVIK